MVNRSLVVKRILLFILLLIIIASAFMVVRYFMSLRYVTVNFDNTSKVEIYKSKTLDSGKAIEPYKTVLTSGEEIKIPKGNYTAYYKGSKGYDSKYIDFSFDDDYTLDIKPALSDDALVALLNNELPQINKAILSKYPSVNSVYKIQKGKLFENGTYYGTTLVNTGDDYFNNDTLRIILKKSGPQWMVITDPPAIYLNKFDYPNIPKSVLSDVNSL